MYYLVEDREQNLYHDSYFYATIFNPETFDYFEFEYGSTAYATAPTFASNIPEKTVTRYKDGKKEKVEFTCDTPQEIKALYRRVAKVHWKLELRQKMKELARELHLDTYHEAWKIRYTYGKDEEFEAVCKLLRVKNFRSNFRKSLAEQIRAWLKDPSPKYEKPLSPKQMSYIIY